MSFYTLHNAEKNLYGSFLLFLGLGEQKLVDIHGLFLSEASDGECGSCC